MDSAPADTTCISLTHTHTHTRTHARTHAHTHTHTHTQTHHSKSNEVICTEPWSLLRTRQSKRQSKRQAYRVGLGGSKSGRVTLIKNKKNSEVSPALSPHISFWQADNYVTSGSDAVSMAMSGCFWLYILYWEYYAKCADKLCFWTQQLQCVNFWHLAS